MMKLSYLAFKKGLAFMLLCLSTVLVKAQTDTTYRHLPATREKIPLYIISPNIIGGGDAVNVNDVKSLNVLKDHAVTPPFKNLDKYGVIIITLKETIKVDTKSFNDIKLWLNIKGEVDFAVDGFFIDDKSLLIATASINEINVIKKNPQNKLANTVINIWTLEPGTRKGFVPPPPGAGKPGEIYIR